ncbi:GspH/FimT family pseudopilin [Massilia sp. TSP1-1-2]|uniref:GspH/FimT family pseudopilin n=1 Tax=Massilia sp. TSP1-1-2 TaxID=2804649 RepID=UPI003CEC793C
MRHGGATLVELVVVLAIMAVLASLALPSMRDMLEARRLDTAAVDLYGAIDLARSQAVARGDRVQLVPLEPKGANWAEGWVVFVDRDGDRRPGPDEEIISSHGPLAGGIVVSFNFTSNKLPYYIAYSASGRSCRDTSSLAARWGTISLHQEGRIRRIKINMLGRARMCRPEQDETCDGKQPGG